MKRNRSSLAAHAVVFAVAQPAAAGAREKEIHT
jgi:hypothetical protein